MALFIIIGTIVLAFIVLYDYVRIARPKFIERTECLRIRFSDLRYRLIILAGSEEMTSGDKKAVEFLYQLTTIFLRHPAFYGYISSHHATMNRDRLNPPHLKKSDLTDRTLPLLREWMGVYNDLVQQCSLPFFHLVGPIYLLVAVLRDNRIRKYLVRDIGKKIKERNEERQWVEAWRQAGDMAYRTASGAV